VLPIEIAGRVWRVIFSTPTKTAIGGLNAAMPGWYLPAGCCRAAPVRGVLLDGIDRAGRAVGWPNLITKGTCAESEASLGAGAAACPAGNWSWIRSPGHDVVQRKRTRILGPAIFGVMPAVQRPLRPSARKDRAALEQALRDAAQTGRECELDHRISSGKDETRWVHTIVRPEQHRSKKLFCSEP